MFRAAWRELAPDQAFAGMTLAEFEAATAPPIALREEIVALEKQLEGKKTARSMADQEAANVLELVVNSVRGTPGHGPDGELYRAFGYVRKSERRTGLTRKRASPDAAENVVDADAA
ncbi:hypothetical protein [Luteolibacter marinus]|uniref:hypothetical protein n=1 Tax=Luteolibacter marinus TaxID=2776705 RepID=UPI001866BBD8|nr:hypothetical protein [Luteolibacter marinus]